MLLSIYSSSINVRIEISADQFKRLRDPQISEDEIRKIAIKCDVDTSILINYAKDLKHTAKEVIEIDASCDYTDHFS
jgi:hypothetical protein